MGHERSWGKAGGEKKNGGKKREGRRKTGARWGDPKGGREGQIYIETQTMNLMKQCRNKRIQKIKNKEAEGGNERERTVSKKLFSLEQEENSLICSECP